MFSARQPRHQPVLSAFLSVLVCFLIVDVLTTTLAAQTDVLTSRNDNNRTGANLNETELTTANVNRMHFGHIFDYQVEGNIFAQPLVVTGVITASGRRNVVYVATSNDMLYAFDADGRSVSGDGGLIWSDCFASAPADDLASSISHLSTPSGDAGSVRVWHDARPGARPCPPATYYIGEKDSVYDGVFLGSVGIIGTPVIDRARGNIYLVTRTRLASGEYVQSLHSIDIANGTERFGSPKEIAREPIKPTGSSSSASFAAVQNQRAGLAIVGNRIIVAWAGGTREGGAVATLAAAYRGYVIVFDADVLKATGCFAAMGEHGADKISGTHGVAIWQSGRAPVIDEGGYVYFQTGNALSGPETAPDPCTGLGVPLVYQEGISNSLIKLDIKSGVVLADYTAPKRDKQQLDDCDLDLSGSGPLLIPGTSALVGGGKQGVLHVFDKVGGKYVEKSSRQVYDGPKELYDYSRGGKCQTLSANPACKNLLQGCHHIMSGPVYWDSLSKGKLIYISAENDAIKALRFQTGAQISFQYDDDLLIPAGNLPQIMRTPEPIIGHPGANLSLSAHGSQPGTGILWAAHSDVHAAAGNDFFRQPMPGILRAYDAEDLSHELWNSDMCPDDQLQIFPKYTPPTIANGKVYMASFLQASLLGKPFVPGKLMVYGLRPKPATCK